MMSPFVWESPGIQNMNILRRKEVLVRFTELPSKSNEKASFEDMKLPDISKSLRVHKHTKVAITNSDLLLT